MERLQESDLLQSLKLLFPAIIGVGIKLAIEMKKDKTKVSLVNVCLSLFTGVGTTYLLSDLIKSEIPGNYQPIAIAFIAIISDKIAEFVIYKLNIDTFLTAFFNGLFDLISNSFKR